VIEYNPKVFSSAERITDTCPDGGIKNTDPPIESRYRIPIHYEPAL
jgi:hypothetical protein